MQRHSKVRARLWLTFIFCALAAANFLLFQFSFHPLNPFPITKGLTFGSSLWSAALILGMWLRLGWARYVLIAWLAVAILAFGLTALMMNSRSVKPLSEPTRVVIGALGLYALALVPLGMSRSLRRYLTPRTAGGS
jgi:hypothetical protein